jgi:uncharacterized protein (TIGR00255 family)
MSEAVAQKTRRKSDETAAALPAVATSRIRSMTGYGRASVEDGERVTAEIRSVNGRFLKLTVKVPGRYGALEDRIKTLLNDAGIKRGSVDVFVFFESAEGEAGGYQINETAVKNYIAQARALSKKYKVKDGLTLASLLPLPDAVKRLDREDDIEAVWERAKKALAAALNDFNAMREREGLALAADVRVQLARLAEHRAAILAAGPDVLKAAMQRFRERITKLLEQANVSAPLNPDVLERETVLFTDRTDISEELARLWSHFEQMEAALTAGGETGKKLDFLTQELFRETNTIGSKAQDEKITHRVVEMKGLIEKIREQVQNLE